MQLAGAALFIVLLAGVPDAYRAGLTCFEQLDYQCAAELLGAAARDPALRGDRERLLQLYRLLAESHLALRHPQRAVEAFVELLRLQPEYRLDPATTSPKLLEALERARRRLAAQSPAAATPPVAVAAEPQQQPSAAPAPLVLRLQPAAQLLAGRDAELLSPGAGVDLGVELGLSRYWLLAAGLRYGFHRTTDDRHSVHLVGVWAGGGPVWQFAAWRLGLLAGLGVVRFGVIDREGKTGLLLPLFVQLDYDLGSWSLGLVAGPGWLVTLESDPAASVLVDLGLRLTVEL